MRAPSRAVSATAAANAAGSRWGNSATPESIRKHLKPKTPAACNDASSARLSGTTPPQNPTSTRTCASATARFSSSAAAVVVGGMEFSGMSRIVVTPPAAAARVAVAKPSHSVRPGSLTCTWVSTSPGSSTSSSSRVTVRAAAGGSSYAVTALIRSPVMPTAAATSAPSTIARRARTTTSQRGSAATVGRVAVGAQEHRHVVVALVGDGEHHDDLGKEAVLVVGGGLEPQHVVP